MAKLVKAGPDRYFGTLVSGGPWKHQGCGGEVLKLGLPAIDGLYPGWCDRCLLYIGLIEHPEKRRFWHRSYIDFS